MSNSIIKNVIENIFFEKEFRNYVGYSGIGGNCKRKLWYDYRHAYKTTISARVLRLLTRGEAEEPIIISDLERAGMIITDQQKEVVNEFFPQLKGHIDGIVDNVPGQKFKMLLEMKTANHARFEKIKKQGVKAFSNTYWTQIQCYMSELHLDKCLFVVTNKNNDERLYLVYDYDPTCVTDIAYIIKDVLDDSAIPQKIGNPTWYECKYCDAYEICQRNGEVFENCRNCNDCKIKTTSIVCHKFGVVDVIRCPSYNKLEVLNEI